MEKIDLDAIYVARTQDEVDCFKHLCSEIFRNQRNGNFNEKLMDQSNYNRTDCFPYCFCFPTGGFSSLNYYEKYYPEIQRIEISDTIEIVKNTKVVKLDDDIYFPEDIYIFKNQQNQLKMFRLK